MKVQRVLLACALALATSSVPAFADTFRAKNGFRVAPIEGPVFEVIPSGSNIKEFYWCAAGDYARRALGLDWRTRLYVARGYGISQATGRKSAVLFTTDPEALGIAPFDKSKLVTDILAVGYYRTVSAGATSCSRGRRFINSR